MGQSIGYEFFGFEFPVTAKTIPLLRGGKRGGGPMPAAETQAKRRRSRRIIKPRRW